MLTRFSQSTIRPPPSSPSLIALLELIPPSPILSPSDLSTSITFGEIPILLFDTSLSTPVAFNEQHDPYLVPLDSSSASWESGHDLDVISFHVPKEPPDEYLDHTRTGFETFGRPVSETTRHRHSLCWSPNTSAGDFVRDSRDLQGRPQDDDILVYHGGSWVGASQWDHPLPSPAPSGEDKSEAPISVLLKQGSNGEVHFADTKGTSLQDSVLVDAQSDDSGDISFMEFCTREASSARGVSTLASTSSLSRRPAIYRPCGSPKCRKEFPTLNPIGDAMELPLSQILNVRAATRQGNVVALDHGICSTSSGSPDVQFSAAAYKLPSPSKSPFTSHTPHLLLPQPYIAKSAVAPRSHLQQQYPWLKNMTLSLSIDQEGFRTVQPSFKPTGLSRYRPVESENTVDFVTFVPTAREIFRFHYAPFDGLPVLRRLIINGDETRDFLSRQACLSLKSSGMYTVHGTEIASSTTTTALALASLHNNIEVIQALDSTRLYWQFDYSVEDRRAEQTGRVVDGEKILVPLTFTCSPRLLHPNQGKKVKLVQIVKKTVVPKLMAEKKPLPNLYPTRAPTAASILPTNPSSPSRKTGVVQHATQLYLNKSQAWNLHRRSQSNPREVLQASFSPPEPRHSTRHRNSESTDSPSVRGVTTPIPISQQRRRASSAGESYIKPRTGISPIRHILPPSRLRQLLEEGSSSGPETIKNSEIPQNQLIQNLPLDFFPLRPSPRFKD